MSEGLVAVTDNYASARASLRENVKTLITVFGSVSGVILVGSPFTGFGVLEPLDDRWWVAAISIVSAAILIATSVLVLLRVLRPELAYPSSLRDGFNLESVPRLIRPEIRALRKEFQARRHELLSKNFDSYESQDSAATDAWNEYERTRDEADRKLYDEINDPLVDIGHWSAFVRFHYRVTVGMNIVFFLGLLALLCLGAFSWAVGKKPNTPAPPTFVLLPGISQSSESTTESLPRLPPVHFQTGSSALTKEGYEIVNRARNLLKENGAASLLVYGYTDTRGGRRMNETLAVRRIESVINVLAQEGGIARSRMLAVPLPNSDLPTVTEQDTDEQNNRSVHLVLVRLP